ncbi:MAG TPA: rhomboid family intramembrane serine protease [Candidatus Acidoferrum sp.]|nr:rhomboid family intramembrane serine protease [Candidatus Acidoferrum sp.]
MLEDRDYMRSPEYGPRVSLTVVLLAVNAVVFVVECFTLGNPPQFLGNRFALSVDGLRHGFIWQLLTYQFMHANMWHILINSWALYLFGREVEGRLGGKPFLILFLTAGVVGGIFQALAAFVWPQFFGGPVVGASAGCFGLVAAYATLFPRRELTLLIPPITFHAKTMLILSAVLAVMGIVFPIDNVANAAHLGGMLVGFFYVRWLVQGRWPWPGTTGNREAARSAADPTAFWRRDPAASEEEQSTDEFVKSAVDPILDKISRHGIQSLTARERKILEQARTRMAKH